MPSSPARPSPSPAGDIPPPEPGEPVAVSLGQSNGASWLSFLSLRICAGAGFAGLDTIRLPQTVGQTVTACAGAYDAGTEINAEDFAGTGMSNPPRQPGWQRPAAGRPRLGQPRRHGRD